MKETRNNVKAHGKLEFIELELTFHSDAYLTVYEGFDTNNIKILQDNNIFVKTILPDEDWIYSYLASLYPHLLAIKPRHILLKLQEYLKKSYNHFLNMT